MDPNSPFRLKVNAYTVRVRDFFTGLLARFETLTHGSLDALITSAVVHLRDMSAKRIILIVLSIVVAVDVILLGWRAVVSFMVGQGKDLLSAVTWQSAAAIGAVCIVLAVRAWKKP